MVVFTCNHCGDSLQKPRVEKHYTVQCKRAKSLTCVDCFKDFKNEEYVSHTKCVTEEERYAAKGSIPGGIVKKGDVKQETWTGMIKSIVENEENNLKPSLKKLFQTISNFSNVPRKKPKFINFLQSSTGGRVNFNDIEAAWDLIETYKKEQSKANNETPKTESEEKNGAQEECHENEDAPMIKKQKNASQDNLIPEQKSEESEKTSLKKKQKSKRNGTDHLNGCSEEIPRKKKKVEESSDQNGTGLEKFSFKNTILEILNTKGGSISCKKLQKKVLNAYLKETGIAEYTEKTVKKYNKKLKKLPNVTVNDDTVALVPSELKQ